MTSDQTNLKDTPLHREMALRALQALRTNDYQLAIDITDEILEAEPNNAPATAVRFSSFFKSGQFERARQMGGHAAELNPDSEFILNNQACLQLEAKQPAAASGLLKSLIEKYGETPQWLYNLALAQRMVGNYEYALATFQRTLDLDPEHGKAAYQLADCLGVIGQPKDATRAFNFVRLLRSRHAPSHCDYIHYAAISNEITNNELEQELHLWGDRFIPKDTGYKPRPIENTGQVHIAFLVDLLPFHWFKRIVLPVINRLAMSIDTISLYTHDERIQINQIDSRVNIINAEGMGDSELAKHIRTQEAHIIVDVCGMRKSCRQRALGLRLAHRQFAWLGHEGAFATPRLAALEPQLGNLRSFVDESEAPQQTSFPSKTLAGIGCKNGLSDLVLSSWCYLLRKLPEWKLHLDVTEVSMQKALKMRFEDFGIKPEQLLFDTGLAPKKGSIVLDNFVYNDPVAVSAALRAGGCVVAQRGELFPAQQTAAILEQLGLEKTISETPLDYVNRAIELAQGLRSPAIASTEQLSESGLNDLDRFTQNFRQVLVGDC